MKVVGLHIYPVKSCHGLTVDEAEVTPRGFAGDRRWMIVDDNGQFVTQREYPRLAQLHVALDTWGINFSAPEYPSLQVPFPGPLASQLMVTVWESQLSVPSAGSVADAWLSTYLGDPVHLVYLPDGITRPCTSSKAAPGDEVSFADGFAYLVTTQASLADLNRRMGEPLPMDRFRANIVVDGELPWDEDSWHDIMIGSVVLELLKPCARCKITTTDQETGEVGREPLATLRRFRFNPDKKGLMFGINASPRGSGILRVGDDVTITSRHAPPTFMVKEG